MVIIGLFGGRVIIMKYNSQAIRVLINDSLTQDNFSNLIFYNFNSVWEQFTQGMSKDRQITILLEYVEKYREIDNLLQNIQEINPTVFEEHKTKILRISNCLPIDYLNSISDEVIENLSKYLSRAETFIFASYSRSGDIDQACERLLLIARNNLCLSPSDTDLVDNKLLELYRSSYKEVQAQLKELEEEVINFEHLSMQNSLDQLKVALGLNEEYADKIVSLSMTNYGGRLLDSDNEKAVICFNLALDYDSNNLAAYLDLGSVLIKISHFSEAIEAFEKARQIIIENRQSYPTADIEIEQVESLIKQVQKMSWQHNLVKILRWFSPIPITNIIKKIWLS